MTDMTDTSGEVSVTDTGAVTPQVEIQEDRTFTQADVDKIVQQRLDKHKRKYDGIDVGEYKSLKTAEEEREIEAMKKREEFDQVLAQQKDKFSGEISTLRQELTSLKVDGTLLSSAAARNAVNPDQVTQLLKDRVGLDETGRPVVYDTNKNVLYDPETAEPRSIEGFVNEWLDGNPHFLRSTPGGVVSKGSAAPGSSSSVDLSSLDLSNPADRAIYKKMKADGKL